MCFNYKDFINWYASCKVIAPSSTKLCKSFDKVVFEEELEDDETELEDDEPEPEDDEPEPEDGGSNKVRNSPNPPEG